MRCDSIYRTNTRFLWALGSMQLITDRSLNNKRLLQQADLIVGFLGATVRREQIVLIMWVGERWIWAGFTGFRVGGRRGRKLALFREKQGNVKGSCQVFHILKERGGKLPLKHSGLVSVCVQDLLYISSWIKTLWYHDRVGHLFPHLQNIQENIKKISEIVWGIRHETKQGSGPSLQYTEACLNRSQPKDP